MKYAHALRFLCLALFTPTLTFILTSCSPGYKDYNVMGMEEFAGDSSQIAQGKLAILELEGIEITSLPPEYLEEYQDVIAEGDILNIALYHPKRRDIIEAVEYVNKTIGFQVSNGSIRIPCISSIEVLGLTLEEARIRIQEACEKEIQDVEVFVNYSDRLERKVEVIGSADKELIPVDGKIRLYEVLARSEIDTHANFFMSNVFRDGKPLPIDLHKLMNEGDMSQNIVMRGGDKIYIANPEDSKVMVMGEVGSPRAINLPYGSISLREAIVSAGGIPFTGSKDCIQVIRGNLQSPRIYVLSWRDIIHRPNNQLLLMVGDTVYVSEKPITQWNRFIQQLVPSYGGLIQGYQLYSIWK